MPPLPTTSKRLSWDSNPRSRPVLCQVSVAGVTMGHSLPSVTILELSHFFKSVKSALMRSVAEWGFKVKISMFMRKWHTTWWELVITMGWRHKILYIPGSRDTCISYCVTRSIPHPYWPNHVALTHNHHVLNFGTTFYLIQTLNEFTWQNKGKRKPCWYIYSLMFIPSCRCRGMFALR